MTKDNDFYLKEGGVLKNLKDLAKSLKGMPKNVYEHHVSDMKNDFSAWVKDSIGEVKLGDRIEGQIGKIEMELVVLRHLVHDISKNSTKKPTNKKRSPSKKRNSKKKK